MTTTIKTLCGLTLGLDRDLRLLYPLTTCCEASGKGSANSPTGVCCRACYQAVPAWYGSAITLGMPGETLMLSEWIERLTDCPGPLACATHTMWAVGREFETAER